MNKSELRALCDGPVAGTDGTPQQWLSAVNAEEMWRSEALTGLRAAIQENICFRAAIPELLDENEAQAKEIERLRERVKELEQSSSERRLGQGSRIGDTDYG